MDMPVSSGWSMYTGAGCIWRHCDPEKPPQSKNTGVPAGPGLAKASPRVLDNVFFSGWLTVARKYDEDAWNFAGIATGKPPRATLLLFRPRIYRFSEYYIILYLHLCRRTNIYARTDATRYRLPIFYPRRITGSLPMSYRFLEGFIVPRSHNVGEGTFARMNRTSYGNFRG